MRILHVIRDLSVETGGPVRAINGLTEAQARLGHDVAIVTTDLGAVRLVPASVKVHTVHARAARWAWAPGLNSVLRPLVRAADIVHLHMVWDHPVLAAARTARRLDVPYVLRPCGMFSDWSMGRSRLKKQLYFRLLGGPLRDAAAYHFATDGEQQNARNTIGAHRSFVIPIGVPVPVPAELPAREDLSRRFPSLRGRRIVLFLSRLHPKKHPDLLIDAFARVCAADPALHLVLAGPGDDGYVETLRQRARALHVEDRVLFTGLLSGDAVREAYRAAEVFVLPSAHENFGIAAVEAMAMGCATIISRHLDLAPEIANAGAAVSVELDSDSLAGALKTLLEDGAQREALGTRGREFVRQRFGWEHVAHSTIDAYKSLMKPR